MTEDNTKAVPRKLGQTQKTLLDLFPLVVFFVTNWKFGIFWATGILIVATLVSLAITYHLTGKVSRFSLMGAGLVVVFGAATIYFQDKAYLVAKVTIIELLFASLLLTGLKFNRLFIKDMMGEALDMPDEAWRVLTFRWAGFFVAMSALNLVIYFQFETYWVTFKAFGLISCTVLFALANAPFMAKYIKE